jgi:tryptophanyl-tRNA synthetase
MAARPASKAKAASRSKSSAARAASCTLELRTRFQEQGDEAALQQGRELLAGAASLGQADRERLVGYLEGSSRRILSEPQALLTEASRLPGSMARR